MPGEDGSWGSLTGSDRCLGAKGSRIDIHRSIGMARPGAMLVVILWPDAMIAR